MDVTPRVESLNRRCAAIDTALQAEESHAYHDETRIHTLKVERLHLLEEKARLEQSFRTSRAH